MENPQAQHRFVLEMDTQNVQLVKQEEGTIVAYAEGNPAEVAFVLPAAFMRDAEGNIGTVETDLVEENGKIQVVLNCDEDFLQNAVYPVVVDPLIQTEEHSSAMEDNFVTSSAPNTVQSYSQARLRICKNTSYGECRSFLKFTDLPFFIPLVILNLLIPIWYPAKDMANQILQCQSIFIHIKALSLRG